MYSLEAFQIALDVGFDLVYVAPTLPTRFPAALIERIATRQMTMYSSPFGRVQMDYMTRRVETASHLTEVNRGFPENYFVNERALKEAGVPRYFGANVRHFGEYDFEHPMYKELPESLASSVLGNHHFTVYKAGEETGMKPIEILQTATRNWARAMKLDKDLGTLEPGKLADLLILDRNPLESAENYSSIDVVMKGGDVIDRDTLPTQRIISADPEDHHGRLTERRSIWSRR
jgi:hypothetical protein